MKIKLIYLIPLITGVLMSSCILAGERSNEGIRPLEASPQYRNGKFHNTQKIDLANMGKMFDIFIDYAFGDRVDPQPIEPLPVHTFGENEFPSSEDLKFARLGHSTVLIQLDGKNWLTDPVFSKRASPFQWIGPERFHPVPITIQELPAIEGVIISHNHYDHLDHDSIHQLSSRAKHFMVPLGIKKTLISWGVPANKIEEFDWWDAKKIGDVEIISTPARHFSGRGLFDSQDTLWTSWVMRTNQHSIYFSGDSAYFDGFKEIGAKYGPFDITFLENGAYNKNWANVHMFPEETMQAFKDLKGRLMVPIHNGTFDLALHSWNEPMERISALGQTEKAKVLIPFIGQIVEVANPPENVVWWKPQVSTLEKKELVLNNP